MFCTYRMTELEHYISSVASHIGKYDDKKAN